MSRSSLRGSCGIQHPPASVYRFLKVRIADRPRQNEIDVAAEQRLQVVLQIKEKVKKLPRSQRQKINQKIEVAAHRIERPVRGRAKRLQRLDAVAAAQLFQLCAVVLNQRNHLGLRERLYRSFAPA